MKKNLNCKVAGAFDHPTGKAGTSVSSHCLGSKENCRLLTFKIWKHCQRHNGPEGWVHLSKVTYWVISQVQTQILIKLHLQNLYLALT